MNWKHEIRAAFGDRAVDEDVVEELAQHAALAYERAMADTSDPRESERQIRTLVDEWVADPGVANRRRRGRAAALPPPPEGSSRLAGLAQELRHACRLLWRQPGYSAVAVLTMALGIGATTVLFSLAYGVLFKPLPWPNADRIVRLYETRQGATNRFGAIMTSAPYVAWRERPSTIDGLAGWSANRATVDTGGEPARARVGAVTASLFPLLGVRPLLGTPFSESEESLRDQPPVVLSYGLWQERYGGKRDVVGRILRIDGKPHRVVAVMPQAFLFPDADTVAWRPMAVRYMKGGLSIFSAIARLKPGVTPAQAGAEATARARSGPDPGPVVMAVFGSRAPAQISAVPFLEAQTADVRPAILVFLAAVGLMLVTAIGNIAGIQLARGAARRREMAVRAALGAGSWRLVRQALAENLVIGAAGGLGGLLLASLLHRVLPSLLPPTFPRLNDVTVNLLVAAFALGLALLASVVTGMLPALQARRVRVAESLAEDGRAQGGSGTGLRASRARAAIITGQLAIACVLLLGAALLTRSFVSMLNADRGYDPNSVLIATLSLPDGRDDGPAAHATLAGLLERLEAVPGFTRVALASTVPLTPGETLASFPLRSGPTGERVQVQAASRTVSRLYFASLGIRVVEGRLFDARDVASSKPVAVVNRAFAMKYLGARAVGEKLWDDTPKVAGPEVIGVIENVRHRSVTDVAAPEIYQSFEQQDSQAAALTVAVKTAGDPASYARTLRTIVRAHDASIGIEAVTPMETLLSNSLVQPRLYSVLAVSLGVLALVIAAVGLFGVLGYAVAQRTREIGVRTALGASPADIASLVLKQGLVMAGIGLAAGLGVSFALVKSLSTFLYGITTYDTVSYVGVLGVLLVSALAACAIPAYRAARIDPLNALRG
jgi:putative ABC transport system permease protein